MLLVLLVACSSILAASPLHDKLRARAFKDSTLQIGRPVGGAEQVIQAQRKIHSHLCSELCEFSEIDIAVSVIVQRTPKLVGQRSDVLRESLNFWPGMALQPFARRAPSAVVCPFKQLPNAAELRLLADVLTAKEIVIVPRMSMLVQVLRIASVALRAVVAHWAQTSGREGATQEAAIASHGW